MPPFLSALVRNVGAVLFLRPGDFLEPHPRVLRAYSIASIMLSMTACGALPVQRSILFYVFGFLCMINGPYPWGRNFGSDGPWRAVFALAWCALLAAACSIMVDSPILDMVLSAYLFLAVSLQTGTPEIEHESLQEQTSEQERAELRAIRAAPAGVAMSSCGYVSLVERGPPLARWQGTSLPEYVIDTSNRRWVFQDTSAPDQASLSDGQILLPPGAVYQLV